MAMYSGQFVTVFVSNAAGTKTEITQYVQHIEPQRASAPIDLTTLNAGGTPVAENIVRGEAVSEFSISCLFDPVFAKILRQIIAARGGFTLWVYAGANQSPSLGDELFSGTYTCLGYNLTYNTGQPATLVADVKPCDGGAVVPAISTV